MHAGPRLRMGPMGLMGLMGRIGPLEPVGPQDFGELSRVALRRRIPSVRSAPVYDQ
jgi:hypothetical protein